MNGGTMVSQEQDRSRSLEAARQRGVDRAVERLDELHVHYETVYTGGKPSMDRSAFEALRAEGARATLHVAEVLRNSPDLTDVLHAATELDAAPWDRGPTRDSVVESVGYFLEQHGVDESWRDLTAAHDDDEWVAVNVVGREVYQQADAERLASFAESPDAALEGMKQRLQVTRAPSAQNAAKGVAEATRQAGQSEARSTGVER